ncbi:trypsin alpha-3-like, partial [Oppia nitens]|uniref:trypsin alpha-3-like n=1 Tax=Oppia nitens TaxID=1686743 RepID=UPI0023DA70BB
CSRIEIKPKIIGGNPADISQFPYQVLIEIYINNNKYFYCGGSIISPDWILTASNCFDKKPQNNILVIAGRTLFHSNDGVIRKASQIIQHDNYDPSDQIVNDIALVRLDQPFEYSNTIQSISLIDSPVPDGTSVTISGWGTSSATDIHPTQQLQYLNEFIYNLNKCENLYKQLKISDNNICSVNTNSGTCIVSTGDSGGPLVANGNLIGVLSANPRPCANGNPDIYMSVAAYRSWIQQKSEI